jgi:MtaA/CmuA family methyltransferase
MESQRSDSRQLIERVLRGDETPRTPTGPLAVHFCARVAGQTLREYTTSARALAESVIRYYERFRPDAVWLSADTWVSAEAMGATVGATGDDQPFGGIGAPMVRCAADIDRIPPPDVGARGRYPLMLEALSRIVEALGKEVWIVACMDQYPFSLAAALMGINEIMLKLTDDAAFVKAVMERALEYGIAYGRALAAAGADMLSGGDSPAGLIGPEPYHRIAAPFEARLIAELQRATGKPISLHICGDATPILPPMAATGADVLELDHQVDLRHACRIVGPEITLWGNLDPVGLLARAEPADVAAAAREAIAAMNECGHRRFVLSSGCTLAMEMPFENLDALLRSEA